MFRALIADDEQIIREGLYNLIQTLNLQIQVVATASDGSEAIDFARKYEPELIFIDINMPTINGLEAIEQIKEVSSNSKIIIISGYSEFEYAQKAIDLGVHAYLLKPLDYKNFKQVVKKALESYSQEVLFPNILLKEDRELDIQKDISTKALHYIQDNFAQPDLSLIDIAESLNISCSYLSKIIKKQTGENFTIYVNHLRINLACELLTNSNMNYNISQISNKCGYNSLHYFSRIFKSNVGMSPNKYRERLTHDNQN